MTQQYDEREARKAYVKRRQIITFSLSGTVLVVALVVALLFYFHVFGLGLVASPMTEPNFGNSAPCAVKSKDGKDGTYVANGSVGVHVRNGTTHTVLGAAGVEARQKRGFDGQLIDSLTPANQNRTTIYFGKNAINQAYTLASNFTDATMVMSTREDQLIDVVIGATFNDLQKTDAVPHEGDTITNIEGCVAADKLTNLAKDTDHTPYTPGQ